MKNKLKIIPIILAAMLLFSSCTRDIFSDRKPGAVASSESSDGEKGTPSDESPEKVNEDFDEYCNEAAIEDLSSDPFTMLVRVKNPEALGIDEYPTEIPRTEFITHEEYMDMLNEEKNKLQSFDYNKLNDENKLIFDCIESNFEFNEKYAYDDFDYYPTVFTSYSGVQSQLPALLSETELDTQKKIDCYMSVYKDTAPYFESLLEYAEEQAERGSFINEEEARAVAKNCRVIAADKTFGGEKTAFEERINAAGFLTDGQKADYIKRHNEILEKEILPEYEKVAQKYDELAPKGFDGRLSSLEKGDIYFEMLLRSETGTELSAEDAKRYIIKKLSEYSERYFGFMRENPTYNSKTDFHYYYSDPEEALEYFKEVTEKHFPAVPECEYEIRIVDKALQESSAPASYTLPPVDDMNRNVISLNPFRESTPITIAHEGFPGHLYQNLFFSSTNPSLLHRLMGTTGYMEGYAEYAQSVIFPYVGDNPPEYAQHEMDDEIFSMLIASRLEIGVHYDGWDKERAGRFLANYYNLDDEALEDVYNRTLAMRVYTLTYCLPCLEMMDMRADAEKALGKDFDEIDYHRELLSSGSISFDVLKKRMKTYIENKKNGETVQKSVAAAA